MMQPVFALEDFGVSFATNDGPLDAVRGVSLAIKAGETLALVGESGSGKSQTFLGALGLLASNGRATGTARLGDKDLLSLTRRDLDKVRGREVSFVFQDPMTSLNPSLTIERQLTEVLEIHRQTSHAEARKQAVAMLETVGIPDAGHRIMSYPHELSGGMRQRAMVAMALLGRPRLLIADEPTTALDVTIQAQILRLFGELKQQSNAAIVVITHDLGVVATLADRVAVMYAGRIVETGSVYDVFERPRHPYTRALLKSTPRPDLSDDALTPIVGAPPNPQRRPAGCAFRPRCEFAIDQCAESEPPYRGDDNVVGSSCLRDGHPSRPAGIEAVA